MSSRVLFLTSNGAGLGHLTRSVAIGRRLPDDVGMGVFTLSQAAPLIAQHGIDVEFLYSRTYGGVPDREWNDLYAHRVCSILDDQAPTVASFDGTFPYRGLAEAITARPEVTWVWTRRAMWRRETGRRALERASLFDMVIEPGEYAAAFDPGPTVALRDEVHRVAPIVYSSPDELLDRDRACGELGIDPAGTNVLVQLGAGNINEIGSTSGTVVRRLQAGGATVVVPVSPIAASRPDLPDGVRTVSAYPLAPLFRAFDASVAASGYNSFHELLQLGVPSLFIPNRETAVDDQAARSDWAREHGVALAAEADDPEGLVAAVDTLLDAGVRRRLVDVSSTLDPRNGAEEAADLFARLATGRLPSRRDHR